MSGLAIQGTNASESRAIAIAAYKVSHLRTITMEGEYTLPVEPWYPVKFIYQAGPTGVYNRIGLIFHSGSMFFGTDEKRVLGVLYGAVTGIGNGNNITTTPSLDVIPTENTLKFKVATTEMGIAAMSSSGVKLHIFQ